MSFFKYVRSDNNRKLSFLGVTLMVQTQDIATGVRIQSFFYGIISTERQTSIKFSHTRKIIKIFGYPLINCILRNNIRKYFVLRKNILNISLFEIFKRKYLKYLNENFEDIYVLNANCGEAYLMLTYIIQALISKNKSKKPLLVATAKYHIDLIKLICPQIPYIFIDNFNTLITNTEFKIDKFRFFILFSEYFYRYKRRQKEFTNNMHYFKSMLNELNINFDDIKEMQKINFDESIEFSALKKVAKTNLNIGKFIFIAPEAQTCKHCDSDFWNELIKAINKKGYDVFVNIVGNDIKLLNNLNYKTCNLSLSEAFALAKHSKKIVSLRSGFTEFLLQTGVKMDVLYTQTKHLFDMDYRNVYQTLAYYTLLKLPFVEISKIKEFNMFEISPQMAIDMILEDLGNE